MDQVFTPTYQGSEDSRKPGKLGKFGVVISSVALGILVALLTLLLGAFVVMKWIQATPASVDCGAVGIMCGSGK